MPAILRLFCAAIVLALSVLPLRAETVLVFAAASLRDALDEVAARWQAETGHQVVLSLAGSSTLARQIQAGAPADLFVSANAAWTDVLEADGLLRAGTRRDLLTNRLVLVAPGPDARPLDMVADARQEVLARLGEGKLAMALVEAVPAGIYGKAALVSLGWWESVGPQVAQADNVRAALALVATGEAALGIVYATDAQAEPRVATVGSFPEASHPAIVYPVAVTRDAPSPHAAQFAEYLAGAPAAEIFRAHGFGRAGAGG